jgi:hypothetical protein
VARSIVVFPPDAKPARKECNWRGLFSTEGCHVNKMALCKDTMCALEDKTAKVGIISQHPYLFRASKDQGIAPYLQLSLLTDLNHTG